MSAYGFFDALNRENPNYGLHTYVILNPHQEMGRNVSFLHFLIKTTLHRSQISSAVDLKRLNMMHIPTKNVTAAYGCIVIGRDLSAAIPKFLAEHYDFNLALKKWSAFIGACSSDFNVPSMLGPYLITLAKPLNEPRPVIGEYLFLDMSTIPAAAFPEFIKAYKYQVLEPRFADRQKLDTFRLAVLEYLTRAAEVFPGIKEAFAANIQVKGD